MLALCRFNGAGPWGLSRRSRRETGVSGWGLFFGFFLILSFNLSASVPSVTTPPQSRTVVQGTNHTFSVTAAGTAPLFYQWRKDGSNLGNKTNSTLALTGIQTNDAGFYSV